MKPTQHGGLGTMPIDPGSSPQTAKFMDWYNKEKKNGLVDIKFFTSGAEGDTLESFFAEVNGAIHAPTVKDPELF